MCVWSKFYETTHDLICDQNSVLWAKIQVQFCLLLFHAIPTVFQLYHGGDMIYGMGRRNPEPTLLPPQGIFHLPHHIGMVWEELAFDDAVIQVQWDDSRFNVVSKVRVGS